MLTLIWFLLGVNSLVLTEVGAETKGFPTHITGVRLRPSVNSLMLLHICFLGEGFPTFGTYIGLFPSVNSLVNR